MICARTHLLYALLSSISGVEAPTTYQHRPTEALPSSLREVLRKGTRSFGTLDHRIFTTYDLRSEAPTVPLTLSGPPPAVDAVVVALLLYEAGRQRLLSLLPRRGRSSPAYPCWIYS